MVGAFVLEKYSKKKKLTITGTPIIMDSYQVCNCTAGINLTWTLF